jgi:hypothetical protein
MRKMIWMSNAKPSSSFEDIRIREITFGGGWTWR